MSGEHKIRKNYEFLRVYRAKKSISNKYLVLYYHNNGNNKKRLGVSISKKVGKSVVRNKIKRMIKEVFRVYNHLIAEGYDYIFIVRNNASDVEYKDIKWAMFNLLKRTNRFINKEENG